MIKEVATYFYPGLDHLEKIISDFALEAEKRLGYKPNTVVIHPNMPEIDQNKVELTIIRDKSVLYRNFWFGCEEKEDESSKLEKMSNLQEDVSL